jgi:hypothetical protein
LDDSDNVGDGRVCPMLATRWVSFFTGMQSNLGQVIVKMYWYIQVQNSKENLINPNKNGFLKM